MLHLSESRLFAFSALVFQTVPVLVILHSSAGHLDLICSHQPIIALAGDDVILPCCLEPATSATEVEWTKPGVHPKYVHVHQDGRLLYEIQNPSYHFRTRLFVDELEQGNVSMKISTVRVSDEGKYRCFIPSVQGEAFVHLSVGSVSSPVALVTNSTSSGVVLQCESEGWYPEPEVSWLDGEGNLLPAGPTETVRGPDGLYTVSSRVTVEKRHSNSFTCRVQQKIINQTRETHIQVPDDFFMIHSTSVSSTFIFGLVAGIIILILTAALFMWKRRRKKTKTKGNQRATDGTGERKNQPRSDGNELQSLAEGEETEKPRTENTESEHGRGKNENQTCTEDIVSCCREGRTVRTARGRGKRQL